MRSIPSFSNPARGLFAPGGLVLALLLWASPPAAGQTGKLHMTTGAITSGALDSTLVYQNRALKGQLLHLQPDDLALAVVAGTVRTTSHLPEAGGSEFHPQGVPTGKSFPAAADVYDGASDGIHIYAWRWHEAKLVRFDLDWGNPVVVFSLPMETFSKAYMGVTYDPVTKSVWLSPWIDLKGRLDNYSLDGQLLRSFPTTDPEAKGAGLAMDYSDDTLWFFNWTQNRYEQYSRAGTLLSTLGGMTRIYGAEFDAPSGAARGQVFAWGSNFNGQTNVPPGLDDVVEVAAGRSHSLARRADGSVVAWGAGAINNGAAPDYGQSIVPSNATNVAQITAGYYHSAALRRDGRVVVWGGIDASTRNAPSGATNLAAIDSRIYHTLALRADGNFLAWGNNHPPPPFGVPGATAIAAGANHNLALKPDGMLVGWGNNTYGTTNIPPSATNVVAVDAGSYHNLALRSDGKVIAWGWNFQGQTNVPQGLANVVAIAAGDNSSMALRANGSVAAWGQSSGVVPPGLANVVAIAAGTSHSLALVNDGSPVVLRHPVEWVAAEGGEARFAAAAVGKIPLSYQWQRNGVDIPGAVSPTLVLPSVGATNSGWYRVVVRNPVWTNASTAAELIIGEPPKIVAQPASVSRIETGEARFSVVAEGRPPLTYQWWHESQRVVFGTNQTLILTNLQLANAGAYSVVVANPFGFTTSSNALLRVPRLPSLGETVGQPDWIWRTGGTKPWSPQFTLTGDSVAGARSGAIGHSQESWIETTVTGVGRLQFMWKCSSEFNWDFLEFWRDGTLAKRISGEVDWVQVSVDFSGGTHTVRWRYVKDNSAFSGHDAAWLDEVAFFVPPDGAPEILQDPSDVYATPGGSATFVVDALGWPPPSFQWRLDGKDLPNKTNATLVLNSLQLAQAGVYTVVARNGLGSATSLPARLTLGYPPSFEEHPQDISVLAGADVAFTSKLSENSTPPAQWIWHKNFRALPGAGVDNPGLILTNVSHLDSGSYHVRAQNLFGSASSRSARLSVFNPTPKLLPLALTGWNYDMVVEKGATGQKQVADDAIPIAFFELDFKQLSTGLPPNRVFNSASNSNVLFALEPYELKNALILNSTPTNRAGTLALDQPRKFKRLSIAATSYNGHLALADLRLNFSDGSSSSNIRLNAQDISLGSGSGIGAIAGLDYVLVYKESGIYKFLLHRPSPPGVGMWATEVDLTSLGLEEKFLQSVAFTNRAANPAAQTLVFAVSGEPTDAPPPPFFAVEPLTTTAALGSPVAFATIAVGSQPMSYQWRLNNADLPDETNSFLRFAAVSPAQGGAYTLLARNVDGQTLSAAASLYVLSPTPEPPFLSIAIDPQSLAPRLVLKGEPGRSYTLQSSTNLTRWLDAQSILLTNQEQTLPLPAPQASQFLRVRVD